MTGYSWREKTHCPSIQANHLVLQHDDHDACCVSLADFTQVQVICAPVQHMFTLLQSLKTKSIPPVHGSNDYIYIKHVLLKTTRLSMISVMKLMAATRPVFGAELAVRHDLVHVSTCMMS